MKRLLLCAMALLMLGQTLEAATYRMEDVPNVQRMDRTRFVTNPDGILSADAVAAIDAMVNKK